MKTLITILLTFSIVSAENDTYFIGHSLVNFDMPQILRQFVEHRSINAQIDQQIINGSPLKYNWENSANAQGGNFLVDLQNDYQNLVITEAVPLDNHITWSDANNYVDSFYTYHANYTSNQRFFIYETWHCRNSGTEEGCAYDEFGQINWRERLNIDLAKWEIFADTVIMRHGAENVFIIPGGQALARYYDTGQLPESLKLDKIFSDDIHLTNLGNYYIACLMYSCLYQESPVVLPHQLTNEWE
jgi:hypothetical protein